MTAERPRTETGFMGIGQAVRLAGFVIAGAWMVAHAGEPPPPPRVPASACRDCVEERRAIAKWVTARETQRWQCRSIARDWGGVEDCLERAEERAAAGYWLGIR